MREKRRKTVKLRLIILTVFSTTKGTHYDKNYCDEMRNICVYKIEKHNIQQEEVLRKKRKPT